MTNTFTKSQLVDTGFIDKDEEFYSHAGVHGDILNILGENWAYEGGHDDDNMGYFYLAYRDKDLLIISKDIETGKILSQKPAPKYKFGITKDLDKRLQRYKEDNYDMQVIYSWKIRAFKTLEKKIKRDIITGHHDQCDLDNYFGTYSKYHDGQFYNKSTWGMSEWMHFDEESAESFAKDVELRIVSTMFYRKKGRRNSFRMSHYLNGKTDLYFDESKEIIDNLYSQKIGG